MRRLLTIALSALVGAGIASGQCPLSFEGANASQIGVYIAEVDGGAPVVDYNSAKLFTPASVMKSLTTAAALKSLKGDFRWVTTVMATGQISNGELKGNIVIRGSGDPTLGSKRFSEDCPDFVTAVREALASQGIQKVSGKIMAENVIWPDQGEVPSWELEDIPIVDGAGFYVVNYKDNTFVLSYPSMTTTPAIPGLKIQYNRSESPLSIWRNPGSNEMTVSGMLGRKQKKISFICSTPDPVSVLLSELDTAIKPVGKDVDAKKDTLTLLCYRSPELRDITRSLMIHSDNMAAEATLRQLAPYKSRKAAIAAEKQALTSLGVNIKDARIADGSGLSRHNAVSPRQLGEALRAMADNPDYVNSFAKVGKDGTVRNFMKGVAARDNFVLKSGSMTGVVCYAGYRLDPLSGKPTHVIAVLINNTPDTSKARAAIVELLKSLLSPETR